MRVLSLFSGIGGLELGLELAGVDVELVAQCEIDRNCARVLEARFPGTRVLGDVNGVDWTSLGGVSPVPAQVDLICGGYP